MVVEKYDVTTIVDRCRVVAHNQLCTSCTMLFVEIWVENNNSCADCSRICKKFLVLRKSQWGSYDVQLTNSMCKVN